MAIQPFLAMTAAEIREKSPAVPNIAWMACHFSPYGRGLSNFPRILPEGALLVVDDITPIHGHDPALIAMQLGDCAEALSCHGVLLDFQRPGCGETAALVRHLAQALPCPVAVSELYAQELDCPVFLSPVPPSLSLTEHLAPWPGREIWLDISPAGEVITLTETGARTGPLPFSNPDAQGFSEERLHCHYHIQLENDQAIFTLWRTREDLEALMEEAKQLGVLNAVGLYQELSHFPVCHPERTK